MKILRLLAALLVLAIPASAQLIDYRSLGPTYFGSNTISGVKGIVTGMMGTNAVDGSITNRNQTYGKVSIAGTNAIVTSDTGPNSLNWPLVLQTNGSPVFSVRSDGSVFATKDGDILGNKTDYSTSFYDHISIVDSNRQEYWSSTLGTIADSNFDHYGYFRFLSVSALNASQDYAQMDFTAQKTNGNTAIITIKADASGGSKPFKYTRNGSDRFTVDEVGDLILIKSVTYSWPTGYGAETNYVLTDTNKAGTLSWQPGLLSPTGTNIIRSIATNAVSSTSIGPGTNLYVAQFVNPTNVQNSLIKTVSSNLVQVFLDPAGTSRTNSGTNEWYGEFTNNGTNQWLQLVVPKGHNNESAHLRSMAIGQTSQRAPITINDTLVVEPPTNQFIGHGSVGFVYPNTDDTIPLGSGVNSWHGVYSDTFGFVAQPANAGPQFGTGSTGTGMGITADAAMIQFFRDTGITAAFNKERNAGTLQLDVAGNLIGFGVGISNTAAYLQESSYAGLIGLGTNNSTTAPLRVGFVPRPANGTDKGGAQIVLLGGAGTGTGRGGDIAFGTARPSTTSTTVNSYTTNFFIAANPVTLTESSATLVFSVDIATNKSIGMMVTATTVANDGSVYQTVMEQFAISAAVDSAYTPVVSASAPIATYQRSGTLTTTWTAVQNAGKIDVKCNAVSSLTQTTLKVLGYQVVINTDGTAVISPQ